jgi:tRNA pseudouridine38-40 synthase
MPRYRLDIEYDGRPYKGFQAQGTLATVQGTLEQAFQKFCGQSLRIHAAGRTDTGVHALHQVIHADLDRDWKPDVVRDAMNAWLVPHPIAVLTVDQVPEDWHARFSATGRQYLYRILDRRSPPAIDQGRVWHVRKPLDAEAMNEAARFLIGHHDFTTFRDLQCQAKSPFKTMDHLQVWREGDEVRAELRSRSFLHRQVRSIMGSLAEVGVGRWPIRQIQDALEAKDRRACGPVAPSDGLYLSGVTYSA